MGNWRNCKQLFAQLSLGFCQIPESFQWRGFPCAVCGSDKSDWQSFLHRNTPPKNFKTMARWLECWTGVSFIVGQFRRAIENMMIKFPCCFLIYTNLSTQDLRVHSPEVWNTTVTSSFQAPFQHLQPSGTSVAQFNLLENRKTSDADHDINCDHDDRCPANIYINIHTYILYIYIYVYDAVYRNQINII